MDTVTNLMLVPAHLLTSAPAYDGPLIKLQHHMAGPDDEGIIHVNVGESNEVSDGEHCEQASLVCVFYYTHHFLATFAHWFTYTFNCCCQLLRRILADGRHF